MTCFEVATAKDERLQEEKFFERFFQVWRNSTLMTLLPVHTHHAHVRGMMLFAPQHLNFWTTSSELREPLFIYVSHLEQQSSVRKIPQAIKRGFWPPPQCCKEYCGEEDRARYEDSGPKTFPLGSKTIVAVSWTQADARKHLVKIPIAKDTAKPEISQFWVLSLLRLKKAPKD